MIYADYEYYVNEYLMGMPSEMEAFPFWEKQARLEIDQATHGRIKEDNITAAVKDCACAVAEILYKADVFERTLAQNGTGGIMTSYSNDGQSATFDLSQSVYTKEGKRKLIADTIKKYLRGTGLLYSGVMVLEP